MPRIPPLPEDQWDDDLRPILEAPLPASQGKLGDLNIFPSFANHKDLFRAWLPFGGYLLAGTLPARERELLILRTAYHCRSRYEWGQHVRIAETAGLADEEIRRVADGPDADGWPATDVALLRAADELHWDATISPETWAALAATHDERGLIEITMLVGHYHLVAFTLNALEVEPEAGLDDLP